MADNERTYWRAANGDMQWTAPHHEGTAAGLEANPRWERVQFFTDADLAAHDAEVKAEALRAVVEARAINIPDALGYKVPAVFVEDLLTEADEIEKGAHRE